MNVDKKISNPRLHTTRIELAEMPDFYCGPSKNSNKSEWSIHSIPVFSLPPENSRKPFLAYSGGIEIEQWHKLDELVYRIQKLILILGLALDLPKPVRCPYG